MSGIKLPEAAARTVMGHHVEGVRREGSSKASPGREVASLAATERWMAVVDALSCIKGVDTVTAFCLASEAGCFSRFRSAPAYASQAGLVPRGTRAARRRRGAA